MEVNARGLGLGLGGKVLSALCDGSEDFSLSLNRFVLIYENRKKKKSSPPGMIEQSERGRGDSSVFYRLLPEPVRPYNDTRE